MTRLPSHTTTLEMAGEDLSTAHQGSSATDDSPIGAECSIQTVYEGPTKCSCCKNWVEEYPADLIDPIEERDETKRKAVIVRMRKNHDEGKALVLDSVVIQSQSLKTTLGELFEGYSGITASLKKLVFRSPFHPFHYRWKKFGGILERQKRDDPAAASYTRLLYDVLEKELGDTRAEVDDLISNGVMTYRLLWALYEPGERIYARQGRHDRVHMVESHGYVCIPGGGNELAINTKFVSWTGQRFAYFPAVITVPAFRGTRTITELKAFPTYFHPSKEDMESRVIARGKVFCELSGFHYKAYVGPMSYTVSLTEVEIQVDGRIILDKQSYINANSHAKLPTNLVPLNSSEAPAPTLDIEDPKHGGARGKGLSTSTARPVKVDVELKDIPQYDVETLTDSQLLLCDSYVYGYSLKHNRWGRFDADKLKPIAWNDNAFPNLMLPAGYKTLITSFVETKTSDDNAFDDVIEGKGQGVIMLLVGKPGTGKTLTAEAVADKVRRPLYVLNAGELGQTAGNIDSRLKPILELAEKWNAVLLFDECDVFLARRTTSDFARNEIVAVFLRLLEYYRGILIMTTNRGDDIDPAFHSRIHLTLQYPDLDGAAKEHIWRHFVGQTRGDGAGGLLTDAAYQSLARLPLNGRQIKNTVKIATLLAVQEKTDLGLHHLRTVLQATGQSGRGNAAIDF